MSYRNVESTTGLKARTCERNSAQNSLIKSHSILSHWCFTENRKTLKSLNTGGRSTMQLASHDCCNVQRKNHWRRELLEFAPRTVSLVKTTTHQQHNEKVISRPRCDWARGTLLHPARVDTLSVELNNTWSTGYFQVKSFVMRCFTGLSCFALY